MYVDQIYARWVVMRPFDVVSFVRRSSSLSPFPLLPARSTLDLSTPRPRTPYTAVHLLTAVSGGLPHCFPQFGPGVIQQHGFGRNLEWEVAGSTDDSVTLKLSDNEETMAMWPHPFECLYKVRAGGR